MASATACVVPARSGLPGAQVEPDQGNPAPRGALRGTIGIVSPDPGDQQATVPASHLRPAPRRRSLLILIGDVAEVQPLPTSGEVTVGRSSQCTIRIDHPSMSRRHLDLVLSESSIRIVDQGSANGTTLRGAQLPAAVAVEVGANEEIVAG